MVRLACSPIPRSGGDDVNGSRLPLGRQTRRRVQLKDAVAESGTPSNSYVVGPTMMDSIFCV